MRVTTEIDDHDLDDQYPDDDGDYVPPALVMVNIRTPDGMGHNGAVQLHDSLVTPELIAEAIVSAAHGAARTHSPAVADALARWLVAPPGMEVE